jgi:hypothetical protein
VPGVRPRERLVEQDLTHHLRRQGQEMRAVLHLNPADVHQPQISLMDERRGGERAPALFRMHQLSSDAPQLLIYPRCKNIERRAVTFRPFPQQPCGLGLVELFHESVRNGSF